jgi:activator of HSP90 ATPase
MKQKLIGNSDEELTNLGEILCSEHVFLKTKLNFFKENSKSKNKRVRTTFTEEQLQVLQANFEVDSNPDGQDLERIAQITGMTNNKKAKFIHLS